MAGCLACGNNANEFVGPRISIGMHDNQENQSIGEAYRVPSRFAVLASLVVGHAAGVVENQLGSLKIDSVLDEVALVLVLVPFEANHL